MDKVLQFWNQQAKKHGRSDLATAPDHYYRQLEIREIAKAFKQYAKPNLVLDIGCGNGYATAALAKGFPKFSFHGMDYSPAMITEAWDLKSPQNMRFDVGDVRKIAAEDNYYDTIICTRCLINLRRWKDQLGALKEMHRVLKPSGALILAENTREGLRKLNSLRTLVGLPPIKTRWHNHYLPYEKAMGALLALFRVEALDNIGSLYYILSRVLYARLAADKRQTPIYNNRINQIAAQLPTINPYSGYSPNMLWVLRKP